MVVLELACVAILVVAALLRRRAPGWEAWRRDALIIFLAALVGEDTCIRLYDFYAYAPQWHLFADRTPILIPTIWVCVVLSARDVARLLSPRRALALLFLGVLYDASFIEPIATSSGLWAWKVPGPFGVPLIGTLGWAFFAAAAGWCLERLPGRWRWATVLVAPVATHLLLLATWWGLLRWVGRGTDGGAVVTAFGVALALGVLLVATGRWRTVPLWALAPRIPAALFFVILLGVHGAARELVAYAATFVPPWLLLIRWRGLPAPAAVAPKTVE